MVPFMLPSHTTGTENIVPLQRSGAGRQTGRQAGGKWHMGQFW